MAVRWLLPAALVPPVGAVLLVLEQGPVRALSWTALALGCAGVVAGATWTGSRDPWRWVGAGLVLLTLSGLLNAPFVVAALPVAPVDPSVVVHLLAYPPLLVGVFRLTEPAPRRPDRWAVVDSLVIVVAVLAVGLLVVADGRVDGAPLLVLPLLDLALLISALPLFSPAGRGVSQVLLLTALLALLLTDLLLLVGAATQLRTGPAAAGALLATMLLLAVSLASPGQFAREVLGGDLYAFGEALDDGHQSRTV